MTTRRLSGFGGAIALALALVTSAAHADPLSYAYVDLDQLALPAPYTFFAPAAVVNGVVYGTVFDSTFTIANVATDKGGRVTVGPPGVASAANASGLIGGTTAPNQAALFNGGVTTLIPQLPGGLFTNLVSLGDNPLALVSTFVNPFLTQFAYFRAGTTTLIDFGLPDPASSAFMNNDGVIGLTKNEDPHDRFLHGYRYDPVTATSTPLPPSPDPTDLNVLIEGINAGGDVLGYSFVDFFSPLTYHERVGVWGSTGVFQTYFFETLNSNTLFFNDRDEIVITNTDDGNSYLVPTPGTRLNLADLTLNVPAGLQLAMVVSIDNAGDITGFAADSTFTNFFPFLLEPIGNRGTAPGHVQVGNPLPASIAHAFEKTHPNK